MRMGGGRLEGRIALFMNRPSSNHMASLTSTSASTKVASASKSKPAHSWAGRGWTSHPAWIPLRFAASRLLGGESHLRAKASHRRVLAPACASEAAPAIFDPRELERVKGLAPYTEWATEMSRVQGGLRQHAATELLCFHNVLATRTHLYASGCRERIADVAEKHALPRALSLHAPVHYDRGLWCGSAFSSRSFGNWIGDQLSAELLAEEANLPAFTSAAQTPYAHEPCIRKAAQLTSSAIDCGHFESLWLPTDYGQNAFKCARYQTLRARLRATSTASPPCAGVFILRGESGAQRCLVNEARLAEQLAALGFVILFPEKASFETLRDTLHSAPLVIGVEGSGLLHGVMLMPADACLTVIQPPRRFNNVLRNYTDCIGQRYAFSVADEAEGGFYMPQGRLLRLLERIAN